MSRLVALLVLIDLVQDLDVLLPVLAGARDDPRFTLDVVISHWLFARAPRIAASLNRERLAYRRVDRAALLTGRGPAWRGADAILTASESTAGPHRWVHAAVMRAKSDGLASFVLQHGVDNLASLARSDGGFASDLMFCWSDSASWPDGLSEAVRGRLAAVGRPVRIEPRGADYDLGVFENLHAKTYTDAQREHFLDVLLAVARARPELRIYARAHPAGGWLDAAARRFKGLRNVTYVGSAAARNGREGGAAAAAAARRVITTPSTVALDAAQAGRRVALSLPGGELYDPLPILGRLEDWLAFIDAHAEAGVAEASFVARHVMDGDAVARILDRMAGEKSVEN